MTGTFSIGDWQRRVRVAQGHEPADVILDGGRVVDVFSETTFAANVAIVDGRIAAVGDYDAGRDHIDCSGMVIAPSFIDAHVHTESSLLWIGEFARAVVPHGTGAVVTDPHEIANVAGLPGLDAMRAAATNLPLQIRFTAPSCVPASPFESPGATFGPGEIREMLAWPETVGLGELMNFPGVLAGDSGIGAELAVAHGRQIDGHAPGLTGSALQAYLSSGPGSDHESTMLEEAAQKLRAGVMVMIREGSSARNLRALLPLVTDSNAARVCFCSDDRDAHLLLHGGHMDAILRLAIEQGMDPLRAIRLATWNPANYWRLEGLGAVAPGYAANLVVLRDLTSVDVAMTLFQGSLVARDGEMIETATPFNDIPAPLRDTMHLAPLKLSDLRLPVDVANRAVVAIPGQIATGLEQVEPVIVDGYAVAAPDQDLLKLVCVERHHATGWVGVGYVSGFGLTKGALASSIAHDAHNIIAVGADDTSLLMAIATVAAEGGGLAAVADGQVLGMLPLPIAGLLSPRPLSEVASAYESLEESAAALGSTLPSPFGLLAFLALSVIPRARVTDLGFITIGEE